MNHYNLHEALSAALAENDLNSALGLLALFRSECGFSRSQRQELSSAYQQLLVWSLQQGSPVPTVAFVADVRSREGRLINDVLVQVVLDQYSRHSLAALAELCKWIAEGGLRQGTELDAITAYWCSQGLPPEVLLHDAYFGRHRDRTLNADLGL